MHDLSAIFKQSDSDRSMLAKIPIAPGHPLPQVFTCKVRAATIFSNRRSVKRIGPSKLANAYHDEVNDDTSNHMVGQTARMVADDRGTNVDGSDDLGRDLLGALVIPAGSELGQDRVALAAQRVEGVDDVVV